MHLERAGPSPRFHDQLDLVTDFILGGQPLDGPAAEWLEFFIHVVEQDCPRAIAYRKLLSNVLDHLNPNGEVRIDRPAISEQMTAYLMLMLRRDFTELSFLAASEGTLIIKRGEASVRLPPDSKSEKITSLHGMPIKVLALVDGMF
jgi:hypothetical protein